MSNIPMTLSQAREISEQDSPSPWIAREALRVAFAEIDRWRNWLAEHNTDCEARCNPDACGWRPWFPRRRCPTCPMDEMLDGPHGGEEMSC